jgi:hypothetical protein
MLAFTETVYHTTVISINKWMNNFIILLSYDPEHIMMCQSNPSVPLLHDCDVIILCQGIKLSTFVIISE